MASRRGRMVALIVTAVMGCVLPSAAWATPTEYDLTFWNTAGFGTDQVQVFVDTTAKTVEYKWVSGNSGLTASDFQDLYWTDSKFVSVSSISCGGSPCAVAYSDKGTGNADGFPPQGTNAWRDYQHGAAGTGALDVTFTFASITGSLSATDFVAHVQYGSNCSGFVGGTSVDQHAAESGCTPVPEPVTMFLGGTGLLVMGYVARKRLFGMGRSLAV
jgi:hypothetical protein